MSFDSPDSSQSISYIQLKKQIRAESPLKVQARVSFAETRAIEVALNRIPIPFREGGHNQIITVIYQLFDEPHGHAAIHHHGIPMFFTHVVTGNNAGIFFAQLHGAFGITFQVDAFELFDVGESKHFTGDFKDNIRGTIQYS
jgi:hypothetical protein